MLFILLYFENAGWAQRFLVDAKILGKSFQMWRQHWSIRSNLSKVWWATYPQNALLPIIPSDFCCAESSFRRESSPWLPKFGSKLNPTGNRNVNGNQQNSLGITPLHILACSTKHDLEMYRLFVGSYPKTGDIPMLYAFWCDVPEEIIHFLVESYESFYRLLSAFMTNQPVRCA